MVSFVVLESCMLASLSWACATLTCENKGECILKTNIRDLWVCPWTYYKWTVYDLSFFDHDDRHRHLAVRILMTTSKWLDNDRLCNHVTSLTKENSSPLYGIIWLVCFEKLSLNKYHRMPRSSEAENATVFVIWIWKLLIRTLPQTHDEFAQHNVILVHYQSCVLYL